MTFEDNVKAALDELPPALAAALTNIAVVVEDENPDDAELRSEIRITVLHELAHYFGLDENRLVELGYD